MKTDRRDSVSLARQHRVGELTAVWVPDPQQEAVRDLTRARDDMKTLERHCRQRLSAFLLRHDKLYPGRSKWTLTHFRWLETVKFENPIQQIVFQEYVDSVKQSKQRVADLEQHMATVLETWSLAPVVRALMALRGFRLVAAMVTVSEIGDLSRFDSAPQLMAYLGLVPSEYFSGAKRSRGGITKTGNAHVRKILVEAAWSYRYPARKTASIQRKAEKCSEAIQSISWQAQKRLCGRYRHLSKRNKLNVQVCTAVARELSGFVWAIARQALKENSSVSAPAQ